MKIRIEICESRASLNIRTKLPSRELKVMSDTEMTISGFHSDKPSLLIMQKEYGLSVSSFFLHTNVTVHVHSGNFNLFVTNTRFFVGCLITNETAAFTITQELTYSQDSDVRISDMMMQDFIILQDEQTTTIEPLYIEERETDKHAITRPDHH